MNILKLILLLVVVCARGSLSRGESNVQHKTQSNQGPDFSACKKDIQTGLCCVDKDEEVTSVRKDPILECKHKNVERCHYSYVTQFTTTQEEVCDETFEKQCQVIFKQQAFNETVKKCYKPVEKTCDGEGPEICRCEKLPIEICGAGCIAKEGQEVCHNKAVTSLIDVPEESCELNPQKVCKFVTKLVPKLKPVEQCTLIPTETCQLAFTQPKQEKRKFKTRWCQDNSPPSKGDMYGSTSTTPPPITTPTTTTHSYTSRSTTPATSYLPPPTSYLPPPSEDNYGSKSQSDTGPERLTLLPPSPPPPRPTLPPSPPPLTTFPTLSPPSSPTTRAPLSGEKKSELIYIKVSK